MTTDRWHLITGEYPPKPGGVGDYTALLAAELAEVGSDVHVWTLKDQEVAAVAGVTVHRPLEGWSRLALARLDEELDAFASPRRLLVQYAPNVWGYKGMNIEFCRWLRRRRAKGDDVRVMFHEVWYPFQFRDKPTRWLLALVHRLMTRTLMDACSSAYVSIPAWEPLLRASESGARKPITWLPVPSTIAPIDDSSAVTEIRRRFASGGQTILGSFGTFGGLIGSMLLEILPRLLDRREDRVGLLFGRGSDRFVASLVAARPELAGRLIAAGTLSRAEVSIYLQACDLLVQPYPDGLSSRRTSLMAGLAHGVATVSNLGVLSEPVWGQSNGGVALASGADPVAVARTAESVLACPVRRAELGAAGRALYRREFAVDRTVEVLRGTPAD
ncbi:glycosyltransferase family 4 protein (plasmid) [Singulisphaera sp. Ch08]|uniref:Glycosyltransferase family 4 protein n=1 Tax=Singulisphaera sp. Ch08 TaxID=3120278 RepID=A0AAU7CUU3_9BACT